MFYISGGHLSRWSYWKNRYRKEIQTFDWLTNPKITVEYVLPHLENTSKTVNLLDIGSGSSLFPLELSRHLNTNTNLFCLDYVNESLEFQKRIFSEKICVRKTNCLARIYFICADAEALPFRDNSFRLVFDKGTTDSLLKDNRHGVRKFKAVVLEVLRILGKGGKLLQFTDEDPDIRIPLLEKSCVGLFGTSVQYKILCIDGIEYFVYCVERL